MSTRIEIHIPYFYDPATGLLYNSSEGGKYVRTQFFSDEQIKALHTQEKEIKSQVDKKEEP